MKIWNKYKNLSLPLKASLWYTVCNFMQKGISFVVVPVYVRMLTTGEYGEWNVFQSWRDILIILASLNLYAGVYTKTLVDNTNDRDRYTSSMQGLGTVITVAFLIIYFFTHKWCNRMLNLNTPLMLLLFLYFIVYPAFSFWGTRQRVEYHYKPMVMVTLLISFITPALSILLVKYTNLREKGLILGFLITQCVVGLFFYIYHYIRGRVFFSAHYWKYALKFNVPLIPHYLSLIVLGQSDRIMIKYFCSESDSGIYSFAYQIASVMNVFLSAINGSRVPWSYEQLRDRVYGQLQSVSNILCVLMAAITLMAALLSPDIIRILGTDDYYLAMYVIPIVALGVYFTYCYDMFCTVEFYYGATKFVMLASLIGAVSNIIMNAVFIPMYGFIAAAYTTLASYMLFMLMHYFFMRIVMKRENIKENIYDMKFTVLCSIILCGAVVGCIFTYQNMIVRYVLIIVIAVILFCFRQRIINVITTIKKK